MIKIRSKPVAASVVSAALGIALLGGAGSAQAFTGEKYAKEARISLAEARAIALKAFRGRIVDEELEREKGGSGLRYSFDIVAGRVRQEVGVDAKTGRVLENDREGPGAD
ncbi:MAG: PepSY domain-containing protein [Betaproteobacteria bacterium]|nr:PepSY domain-containing protein [Betaproteobacteria bacterium]